MRVMVVCQDYRATRSGHDAAVHATVRALVDHGGCDVTVVTGRLHRSAETAGLRIIRLPCLPVWHGSLQFLSFRLAWTLSRRALRRRTGAEVVCLASPLFGGGDLAAVHFLSGDWLAGRPPVTGGWASRLRRWHDVFRHAIAARLEHRAYGPDGPRLLPVSDGLAEALAARHPAAAGRLTVVGSPLDLEGFTPGDGPATPPRLVFVGGAWTRKRLDRVIDALALLPPEVTLRVIGRGPEAEMRRRAAALGVVDRVTFLGARDDVPLCLRGALALVLPSDYETDGRVAWEALACSVPVIATPFPGSEGWLRPGETALPARTPEEIAAAVHRLLQDPAGAARMGAAGRRHVEETRSPAGIAAHLRHLFGEVRP